jgi:hypothetical protein
MAKIMLTGADTNNQRVINVASPSSGTDAANKNYVDALVAGLTWKNDVRVATTANGTLASAFANGSTIDGQTLATGDRILIKDQTTQSENGIYTVNASGAPTRATDADATTELNNATVTVLDGTVNSGKSFTQTTKNPTIGSSNIVWATYAAGQAYTASLGVVLSGSDFRLATGVSGAGLTLSSGVLDVVAADTSLTVNADSVQVNPAAGGGLTVSSGLKVDRTKVPNVFNADIGDGSTTALTVTHNLATKSVTYSIRRKSDDVFVDADVVATSTNVLTITFASAPSTNQYNVTVVG